MRRKRALVAGLAAVVWVAAGLAGPSRVSADYSNDVVFTGTAALTPGVALVGGGGAFTFTSTACAGASNNDLASDLCTLTLSGTYTNIVCGTGSATGSGSITGVDNFTVTSFNLTLVNGFGVVSAQLVDPAGTVDTASGLVEIAPTSPGGGGACANSLAVTGVVAITSPVPDPWLWSAPDFNGAATNALVNTDAAARPNTVNITVDVQDAQGRPALNVQFTWQVIWADGSTTPVTRASSGNTGSVVIPVNIAANTPKGEALFVVRRGNPPKIVALRRFAVN